MDPKILLFTFVGFTSKVIFDYLWSGNREIMKEIQEIKIVLSGLGGVYKRIDKLESDIEKLKFGAKVSNSVR